MTSLQPTGYIAECFRLFCLVVKGPKGTFCYWDFPATSGSMGWELGTPKFAQIFAYRTMLLHGVSDLDHRRLKMRHFTPFGGINDVALNAGGYAHQN